MAGSQKITLWGPQRTPLGILRVKCLPAYKINVFLLCDKRVEVLS